MYNFDSYNVFLVIATNIPVLLMTAFVLQEHLYRIFFVSKDQGTSKVMLFNFNNAILNNGYICKASIHHIK